MITDEDTEIGYLCIRGEINSPSKRIDMYHDWSRNCSLFRPNSQVSNPLPPNSSLTDRVYGIFQIQGISVIKEIAESDYLG